MPIALPAADKKEVVPVEAISFIGNTMGESHHINQEIEIKLDLGSFTNYLKLIGFLGQVDREEQQVNAFFDTEDGRLSSSGWALRIRSDDHRGFVTLKSRESKHDHAAVRSEIEAEITRSEALDVVNLKRDVMSLDAHPIEYVRREWGSLELTKLVHFENTRQYKAFKFGDYMYDLEIDTTRFADGSVEYELEVELPDESQVVTVSDRLRKLFGSLDIPFAPQADTKFARALAKSGNF